MAKGFKSLRPGALPTRNLPKKSHDSVDVKDRKHINIVQEEQSDTRRVAYQNIASFRHGQRIWQTGNYLKKMN